MNIFLSIMQKFFGKKKAELNTINFGIIKSFDATKQTGIVQFANFDKGGTAFEIEMPLITFCNFFYNILEVGTPCLIFTLQRDLAKTLQALKNKAPQEVASENDDDILQVKDSFFTPINFQRSSAVSHKVDFGINFADKFALGAYNHGASYEISLTKNGERDNSVGIGIVSSNNGRIALQIGASSTRMVVESDSPNIFLETSSELSATTLINNINFKTHKHIGVSTGGGTSGTPVA